MAIVRRLLSPAYDSQGQAWLTRHVSQPIGRLIAAVAYIFKLTPNVLTLSGLVISLAGSAVFAWLPQDRLGLCVAAILLQLAFGFDCADGQLARALHKAGPLGAWLDIASDFVRQAGLSIAVLLGLIRAGIASELACLVCFIFLSGQLVYLHTAFAVNVHKPPRLAGKMANPEGFLRKAVATFTDTPLLLLMVPALACWPTVLCVFLLAYGAILLLRGGVLGYFRIGELH